MTSDINKENLNKANKETQTNEQVNSGSYQRVVKFQPQNVNFRWLVNNVLYSRNRATNWCFEKNLIAKSRVCKNCKSEMLLRNSNSSSDGMAWRCQKKGHYVETSIRKDSWFESSNMTLEEIIELTYWWSTGIEIYLFLHIIALCTFWNLRRRDYFYKLFLYCFSEKVFNIAPSCKF